MPQLRRDEPRFAAWPAEEFFLTATGRLESPLLSAAPGCRHDQIASSKYQPLESLRRRHCPDGRPDTALPGSTRIQDPRILRPGRRPLEGPAQEDRLAGHHHRGHRRQRPGTDRPLAVVLARPGRHRRQPVGPRGEADRPGHHLQHRAQARGPRERQAGPGGHSRRPDRPAAGGHQALRPHPADLLALLERGAVRPALPADGTAPDRRTGAEPGGPGRPAGGHRAGGGPVFCDRPAQGAGELAGQAVARRVELRGH